MAYKTRRQNRYETLRNAGFVNFEARALSRVSLKLPYILPLMKERYAEYQKAVKRAKAKGLDQVQFSREWLTHIKRRYIMKGWKRRTDSWGVTTGFRMLKAAEKSYKYKTPSYNSPWEKRQKDFRNFIAKIDKSYEKYPRGAAYGRKARTAKPLPGRVERNPETGKFEVKYE